MSKPGEHKTVQARILAYAQEVGWTIVSRDQTEKRIGDISVPLRGKVGDRNVPAPLSLFFDDLLDAYPPSSIGYAVTWVRVIDRLERRTA